MRNQFLITLFLLATLSFTGIASICSSFFIVSNQSKAIVASGKEEEIQEFTEWAESKGAVLNFKLTYSDNGYKAIAKNNLEKGENIVSIPMEFIIANSEVKEELKIEVK